jgi:tetratricopeptide (TPR) repeat protein
LYERALSITEQALGPMHPNTARSLNNLAGLLESQGEYGAARPLYERALAIREQALGPLHPDTATSLNNLAGLLGSQGEYGAARSLYERALAICERSLGVDHPTTRTIRNNLAINQQIAEFTAQAQAAVVAALADSSLDRAALAQQLEVVAQQVENGQQPGSPYLALAAKLRALITQLDLPDENQQLAELLQRAQAATERALASDDTTARADLAERLAVTADAYAGGEQPSSPRYQLAAELRALAARLKVPAE